MIVLIFQKLSIPKELNFFDTNLHGNLLKDLPLWDRNLYVSLCIEVLQHNQGRAEPVVVVRITVIAIAIENSSISSIAPIATTIQER